MDKYFAVCARGLEAATAQELKALGAAEIREARSGVEFCAEPEILYRALLGLRTASRVLRPLRDFASANYAMLYDQVRRIPWENYLTPETSFAIDCVISGQGRREVLAAKPADVQPVRRIPGRGVITPVIRPLEAPIGPRHDPTKLEHSHFAALKIKDAIADRMRRERGARPNVNREDPDVRIHALIKDGRCTISLDASGASLHERGYRRSDSGAPLKETLAAGLIQYSGWDADSPFLDPMCGSGTIVIEAAMMALKIAPGLRRARFGCFGWPEFNRELWDRVVAEVTAERRSVLSFPIVGWDDSPKAIAAARENARIAGVDRFVKFEQKEIGDLEPIGGRPGTVIVNPPYGERLGNVEYLRGDYEIMGDLFKKRMAGWKAGVFTGNPELAKAVGLKPSRKFPLWNGPIECRLLKYDLYEGSRREDRKV